MLDNETRKRIEMIEIVFAVFLILAALTGMWFFNELCKLNREAGEHNVRLKHIEANLK
jgi:hypothetical protein